MTRRFLWSIVGVLVLTGRLPASEAGEHTLEEAQRFEQAEQFDEAFLAYLRIPGVQQLAARIARPRAERYLQLLREHASELPSASVALIEGELLVACGNRDEALLRPPGRDADDQNRLRRVLARIRFHQGRTDDALSLELAKIEHANLAKLSAAVRRGQAYEDAGRPAEAAAAYEQAIGLTYSSPQLPDPDEPTVQSNMMRQAAAVSPVASSSAGQSQFQLNTHVLDRETDEFREIEAEADGGDWHLIGATTKEIWADVNVNDQLRHRPALVDSHTQALRVLPIENTTPGGQASCGRDRIPRTVRSSQLVRSSQPVRSSQLVRAATAAGRSGQRVRSAVGVTGRTSGTAASQERVTNEPMLTFA